MCTVIGTGDCDARVCVTVLICILTRGHLWSFVYILLGPHGKFWYTFCEDVSSHTCILQVNAFLMKMVQMLGFLWTNHLEYKAEGSSCINFPEFVTLVTEYFHNLNLTTALTCELIGIWMGSHACMCVVLCYMGVIRYCLLL